MGVTRCLRHPSNVPLQRHIRRQAQTSARVIFLIHTLERMAQRSISDREVFECLRHGVIQRPPQWDDKRGALRCRMEHFGSRRNLAVVVALDDATPDLIVVTVMI